MNTVKDLLSNKVLIAALLSWFSAQLIKTVLCFIKTKKFNMERVFGAGGMPSSHSSTVCALAVMVARVEGYASTSFAIVFLLAAIVMYDAMGVRRAAGEQAKVLNKMILLDWQNLFSPETSDNEENETTSEKALKEFLGHTPLEVLAGAMLGILIALLIPIV